MTIKHFAVLNYYVFTDNTYSPAICIPARFDRNEIVACIKTAIADDYIFSIFRITAIVVRAMTGNCYTVDNDFRRFYRMNDPERRIYDFNVFQHHVLTVKKLNKTWSDVKTISKNTVCNRNAVFSHIHQKFNILDGSALSPAIFFFPTP